MAALLAEVQAEIGRLQESVQGGALADARSLGARIEALMAVLHDLPRDVARQHLPLLESLCQAMDGLVEGCRQLAESSRAGLHQIPTLLRASNAYAKQGAVAGTAREDESSRDAG